MSSSSSSSSGAVNSSAIAVPGWLEWLGELGIALPLLMRSGNSLTNLRICYWSLNWGRVVLHNVTLYGVYMHPEWMQAPFVVVETGGPETCTSGSCACC
jgi:hypothetical protein